ncbi:MAG: DEAD/DEAH box helicase [Faecalibacterium sp.]
MLFSELSLREEILRAIGELGFEEATEIQSRGIPVIAEGKDVMGRSSTGTGKTAAFGIPAVQMASQNDDKATVLILSPTRELAVQIAGEIRKFSKYIPSVPVAVLYGGAPMENQIFQLRSAKIVIGTPGRVMDHLRRRTLKLQNLKTVILDEADEMLNMGFVEDIQTILETAPEERQTVLFSATMPSAIVKISQQFQKDPVKITVDLGQKTAANIVQSYYNIPQAGKVDALKLLMEYHHPKRSLIFCNTKKMVDELCEKLCDSGFKATGLHGDLKQSQRNMVMAEFKNGRANILIATDVAARGIDVDDVEAVFNYDIPQEYEYYIHRIGRTGRAGRAGASYTLAANRNQIYRIREIERYIGAPIKEMPVPSLESIATHRMEAFATEVRVGIAQGVDDGWKEFVTDLVAEGFSAEDIAASLCEKLYGKNQRLAAVQNVKSFGAPGKRDRSDRDRDRGDRGDRFERRDRGNRGDKIPHSTAGRCWIRATIGSDAKIGPNFIVSAVADASGLPGSAIGKINIYPDYTDIDLNESDAPRVLEAMQGCQIKGKRVEFALTKEANNAMKNNTRSYRERDFARPRRAAKPHMDNARHEFGGDRPKKRPYKTKG